jgi:riboflavin synthase
MPETLKKTSLSSIQLGSFVNLERAMAAGGRFGGHFVSGHVDGVGTIERITPYGNAVVFTIFAPADLLRYMIPKGSVAVDGISLTIVDVSLQSFTVSVIPHTLKETILQYKKQGDLVNLECDMIAKYIERFVSLREQKEKGGRITEAFLAENGFI